VVPADARPGETKIKVDNGLSGEACLVVTVPSRALPGDLLALARHDDGAWEMRIVRGHGLSATGRTIALPHGPRTDPDALFGQLVQAGTAAGGFVSPKLRRCTLASLRIAGVVVCDRVNEGEQLARIPPSLFLSPASCEMEFPELFGAVRGMQSLAEGRREEAALCACLTHLLHSARRGNGCSKCPRAVWSLYAAALLGESFVGHPYWRCIHDYACVRSLLEPSNEHSSMVTMAGDVIALHSNLSGHIDQEVLGPEFDLGVYFQARLCVLTRLFHHGRVPVLVPIIDFCNHAADPGASWQFGTDGAMVLTATRSHSPGEEVHISYGKRSNVLLFRTYGFTISPISEPSWTYIFQGGRQPPELRRTFEKFLPQAVASVTIQLETRVVQDSLVACMNACIDHGRGPPEQFLKEICTLAIASYECDESLQPALAALRCVRALDPSSSAWWAHVTDGEASPRHCDSGSAFADWTEHVVRVKMSEYLCLTAHLEALDAVSGYLSEDQCLASCASLRKTLRDILEVLARGIHCACPVGEE